MSGWITFDEDNVRSWPTRSHVDAYGNIVVITRGSGQPLLYEVGDVPMLTVALDMRNKGVTYWRRTGITTKPCESES